MVHLGNLRLRREVDDVLAFLRFALEPTGAHLAAAAAASRLALPPADACATLVATALRDASGAHVAEPPTRPARVREAAWTRLTRLADHASLVRRGPLAARLVDWLCGSDGPLVPLLRDTRPPEARTALVAIHHLLNVCRDHEVMGGVGIGDLEKRLGHARSLEQRTRFHEVSTTMPDVDAVELLTIRASRGREFEVVHAFGLHAKPRKAGRGGGADERANLTVALSRARDRLHASWSAKVDERVTRPLEPLGGLVGLPPLADARRGARTREAAARR